MRSRLFPAQRPANLRGILVRGTNLRKPIRLKRVARLMPTISNAGSRYRGRIAPTPTGLLHLGHFATFRIACERACNAGGVVVFRNEDIDPQRCRPEFAQAALEDLRWAGLDWQEGPDIGGPCRPYEQSRRLPRFRAALETLRERGQVFACRCSRRDLAEAAVAPHEDGGEPIYPGTCRKLNLDPRTEPVCWRFRVPDGENVAFVDGRLGERSFVVGRDFGDFVVWRRDNVPAYELAVVVDDAAMAITEVVRGEDLLLSTARQILLYRALGMRLPEFYHCPLVRDDRGRRLAKRTAGLSLRELRDRGVAPAELDGMLRAG